MFDDFDNFSRQRAQKKSDHERIVKEASSVWASLFGLGPKFADGNRGFDDQKFSWVGTALYLGEVCAKFQKAYVPDAPEQGFSIIFSRAPSSPGKEYHDKSPISEEAWGLELHLTNGVFTWSASNGVESTVPTDVLFNRIAKRLLEYHQEFEKAYGR
jgi:hypothetical protein